MCTVTYLPGPAGSYIFTSNRDEQANRSPEQLSQIINPQGLRLILPQDTGGGSWIVLAENGRLACLLNGAFVRHQRQLPYRRSRGLVVLDFFNYSNGKEFWQQYDFAQIEPFTLITVEAEYKLEGRWDGEQVHLRHFPTDEPQIWASATLYTQEMQQERQQWWSEFLHSMETKEAAEDCLLSAGRQVKNFHLTAGKGDPATNLRMSRPEYGVATVSVSQVVVNDEHLNFSYHELLKDKQDQLQFPLQQLSNK